jgi:hypothetical protein
VTFDSGGNIYGSAYAGGDGGNGVIFEVAKPRGSSRTWSEKVLHRFSGGTDGGGPESAVSFNVHGDLFGTANFGSTNAGNVFELKPLSGTMQSWRFNILYGFNGPPDGALPAAPVVLGQTMFFGTTTEGGSGTECRYGCGSVFELKP